MDLRAPLLLRPVVAGPAAALGRRLDRAAVEDDRGGLGPAALQEPGHDAEVVGDMLEDAGLDQAAGLLVHGGPRREVVRQQPPLAAGLDDISRGVEQLAEGMLALRGILPHQGQIRREKLPLGVGYVGGVRFPGGVHDLT